MYTQPYNCAGCIQYTQPAYSSSTYAPQYSASSIDSIVQRVQEFRGSHKSSISASTTPIHYDTPTFTYEAHVQDYFTPQTKEYHAVSFLKQYRPATQFIAEAEQVEPIVKETFEKTTGKTLPSNIIIHILDEKKMKNAHGSHNGIWNNTILGFSLNSVPYKHVFVKHAELDQVMAVIGHEIGHVLTPTLPNMHDEEAKAFAFEFAWINTIVENNINNLENNFTLEPAKNGLHDVAANFVKKLISSGKEVLEIYKELAKGIININDSIIVSAI
ncbi:MAG: hypothetical protein WC254_05685 [Candidatus Woesearchaeota archaeon]|jgi:hypothetical protein